MLSINFLIKGHATVLRLNLNSISYLFLFFYHIGTRFDCTFFKNQLKIFITRNTPFLSSNYICSLWSWRLNMDYLWYGFGHACKSRRIAHCIRKHSLLSVWTFIRFSHTYIFKNLFNIIYRYKDHFFYAHLFKGFHSFFFCCFFFLLNCSHFLESLHKLNIYINWVCFRSLAC